MPEQRGEKSDNQRCDAHAACSGLREKCRLGEDRTDGVRFLDARQPHIETLEAEIKALVVNTELMQNRSV